MAEFCRVCLNRSSNLIDIFVKQETEEQLPSPAEMINECTYCQIEQIEMCNAQICESCLLAAKCAFKLRQELKENYASFADMEEACCVCRSKSITLVDIFAKRQHPEGEPCLSEMLNVCLGMESAVNEQVPRQICLSCILSVQNSFYFKRKCEESLVIVGNKERENFVLSNDNEWENVEEGNVMNCEMEDEEEFIACGNSDEEPSISFVSESRNCPEHISDFRHGLLTVTIRNETEEQPHQSPDLSEALSSPLNTRFQCPSEEETSDQDSKSNNMNRENSEEEEFIACESVPQTFDVKKIRENVKRKHIVDGHTGGNPFKCSYCTKSFTTLGYLKDHIRIHTGEKPYKCPHCKKSFTLRQTLGYHIQTHTKEKPYECEYCHKKFARKQTLGRHIRHHTGDLEHQCPYCLNKYATKSGLRQHLLLNSKCSRLAKD